MVLKDAEQSGQTRKPMSDTITIKMDKAEAYEQAQTLYMLMYKGALTDAEWAVLSDIRAKLLFTPIDRS